MIDKITYLNDLLPNDTAVITKVLGHGAFRKRITEMGFVKGQVVKVIKAAPLQDPVEYQIMGYNVSLRRSEAKLVEVVSEADAEGLNIASSVETTLEDRLIRAAKEKGKVINVALVGNPNCGKTTLFNYATGSHERVGNYSGVTIDAKEGLIKKHGYLFNMFDLPGTYSITEYTPEELYVRNHILENKPDVVLNIIDASNLQRNLYLTTQLIDMNVKVVIALNMYDELTERGDKLDYEYLGQIIGIPIIPTVASKNIGVDELLKKVIEVYEDEDPNSRHVHINYGKVIEGEISKIQKELWKVPSITDAYSTRYIAVKLLEKDKTTLRSLESLPNYNEVKELSDNAIKVLEKDYNESSDTVITDAKYAFVDGALKETYVKAKGEKKKAFHIDDVLTHRIWGFPIFVFFLWLMFQATFTIGEYPMGWIESGVELIGEFISEYMPEGSLKDLLIDGVIGGVGGVLVFLPNIMILFFFISLMEDTGYMARTAFIMDRLMHKIGLHGKSFIPMLMGFGCNVPAVMATRTLENKKDRILTMLIVPFMSCSARLPVYVLLISALFTENQGLILISIYALGVLMAVLTALALKKIYFKQETVPFVMELPPYRKPTLKNTTRHMWHKASEYLRKMGTVILVASIFIWALGYYPQDVEFSKDYEAEMSKVYSAKDHDSEFGPTMIRNISQMSQSDRSEQLSMIEQLETMKEAERLELSYIGRIGHAIEPIMLPLGFDWKIGISIVSGLAAKEIVVSTMGVIYQAEKDADETSSKLIKAMRSQRHRSGKYEGELVFTPLVAYGFMAFVLIYFPCIATIAAIGRESKWKWAIFSMVYTTLLAWIVSYIIHQIGVIFQIGMM